MIVKAEVLQNLRTMVRAEYQSRLSQLGPKETYKSLVTIISSNTAQNTYAWLGKFPKLREWIGARVIKAMAEHGYAITNKKFESTLGVERTDIEDDNLGIYKPLAQAEADAVVDFFNEQVALLLTGGFASLCYDGQFFFDTDHPVYPNVDGTGDAVATSNIVGAGTGTPWYLLNLDGVLRPLILQQRTAPEFDELSDTKSDNVFLNDQFLYGIRYRGNFGYGFWQQAVASKLDLTAANFQAAKDKMASFTADGGSKLGIRPTHLVVPQSLESAANDLINKANLAGGESNVYYHAVEVIVNPWL
jgi:phage major head subunit gpT-like protein